MVDDWHDVVDEDEEEEGLGDGDEPAIAFSHKKNMVPPLSATSVRLSQRSIALTKWQVTSLARNLNHGQVTAQCTASGISQLPTSDNLDITSSTSIVRQGQRSLKQAAKRLEVMERILVDAQPQITKRESACIDITEGPIL